MSRGSWVRSPPGVYCACSVMVIIGASQALDPGSIPGERKVECLERKTTSFASMRHGNCRPDLPYLCLYWLVLFRGYCFHKLTALIAQSVEHGSNEFGVGV